nr:MAG TPA: hypothetical protein [Caudoviricetes sp.]
MNGRGLRTDHISLFFQNRANYSVIIITTGR